MTSRLSELVTESERARLDLQMLFGVHVYARAKVVPDLALSRGEDAYRAARLQGDRSDRVPRRRRRGDDPARARRRRGGRAVARPGGRRGLHGPVAEAAPSSSRRGAGWSGPVRATRTACAATSRRPSRWRPKAGRRPRGARPWPGWPSRRRGSSPREPDAAARPDPALVELVERSAAQVKEAAAAPARARAVGRAGRRRAGDGRARARRYRGRRHRRRRGARRPSRPAHHEDTSLEILIPAARAVLAGGPPEVQDFVRAYLRTTLSRIAQGTADESIRVRWLTGPLGRELVELAGPLDAPGRDAAGDSARGPAGRAGIDLDDTRAPPAAAPDRGSDERRDRRRARPRRGRRRPAPGAPVRRSSARRAAPRRPRWRSAGSRPWGPR